MRRRSYKVPRREQAITRAIEHFLEAGTPADILTILYVEMTASEYWHDSQMLPELEDLIDRYRED